MVTKAKKPKPRARKKASFDLDDYSSVAPAQVFVPARMVAWEAIKDSKGQGIRLDSGSKGVFVVYEDFDAMLQEFGEDVQYWTFERPKPPMPEKKAQEPKAKKNETKARRKSSRRAA